MILARWSLVWALGFSAVACCAAAGETAAIAGTVRDASGKPLEGVKLTAGCGQGNSTAVAAVSDRDGKYRLVGIAAGECTVSVKASGFEAPATRVVVITTDASLQSVDFKLTGAAPKFEAAGIRGLIDPGGYSAPANAAASGLVKGIADIKRADNEAHGTQATACSLGPGLVQAVAAAPESLEANLRLGRFYIAHGQFDSARALLSALAPRRNDPEIHALLAQAEEGLGMFAAAAGEYEAAATLQPTEQSLFGVGYEQILAGSPAKATKAFQTGFQLEPRSIQLAIGLGAAQFLDGHDADAVHSFLSAAAINPSDPRVYPLLVRAFVVSGAEADAVRAALGRLLDLTPGSAEASYLFAVTLLHQRVEGGVFDSAAVETLLKRAIEIEPSFSEAHVELAGVCAGRGDNDCALRNYEVAVRLLPGQADVHYRLATAYRKAGRADAAERELDGFREIRAREKTVEGNTGSDLRQFISVFAKPGRLGETTPCPPEDRQ